MQVNTICTALQTTKAQLKDAGIESFCLDAELLVANAFGVERTELLFKMYDKFPDCAATHLKHTVKLRLRRMPMSHILQKKEFFGIEFFINHTVIAPRPETELLVELCIKYWHELLYKRSYGHGLVHYATYNKQYNRTECVTDRKFARCDVKKTGAINGKLIATDTAVGSQFHTDADNFTNASNMWVMDLGTGSGCIIISVLSALRELQHAVAVDSSKEAIEVAKFNARKNRISSDRLHFALGDWLDFSSNDTDTCTQRMYDIILCNPPYVPYSEWIKLEPEVRDYEPIDAISDGDDGTTHYRTIIRDLGKFLIDDGVAIFEVGHGQAETLKHILECSNFTVHEIACDLAGIERAVVAKHQNISM